MKTLFYYCYYRISKFYEDWGEKNGHVSGSLVLFLTFAGYFLSLLIFILSLFDKRIHEMHDVLIFNENLDNILIFGVPVLAAILSLFFINRKKYEELVEKYKDEKHKKIKGWLVFLYCIGSIASFFTVLPLT